MFAPVRQLRLTKRNIGGAHEDNATADPGPNVWNFAKHEETQGAGPEQAEEIQRQQCRRISAFKSAGKAQMAALSLLIPARQMRRSMTGSHPVVWVRWTGMVRWPALVLLMRPD